MVAGGVIIILFILALGQRSHLFTRQYSLTATFENAGGLISGASVRVAGVNAGTVRGIRIVREPSGDAKVQLDLSLGTAFQADIRDDSVATIRSLGLLGDKYVEITLGSESAPRASGRRDDQEPGHRGLLPGGRRGARDVPAGQRNRQGNH